MQKYIPTPKSAIKDVTRIENLVTIVILRRKKAVGMPSTSISTAFYKITILFHRYIFDELVQQEIFCIFYLFPVDYNIIKCDILHFSVIIKA